MSSVLGIIISYISNFKFSFITIGYFLEKNFYTKKNNKKIIEFSIYFILKRIIINLRLNNSVILLIFNSLIKMKEEELLEFYSYFLVDFILFFFDYLCIVISLVIFKILN